MEMKAKSKSAGKSKGNGSAKQSNETRQLESTPARNACSREQMIAEAAYYLAERRGFAPGNEMYDWFEAEAEVTSQLSSAQ